MTMTLSQWQDSFDAQQQHYLPDREQRFAVMLDVVAAVAPQDRPLRVLDLACGIGSISSRLLHRFPDARVVLLDLDPALLELARRGPGTGTGTRVVQADLDEPRWRQRARDALTELAGPAEAEAGFDAVLTATALHWITPQRLAGLFGDIAGLLRPGGVFCNADHMPDEGLASVNEALAAHQERMKEESSSGRQTWEGWLEQLAADPEFAELMAERRKLFAPKHGASGHSASHHLGVGAHLKLLAEAGFTETGIEWRSGTDAMTVAVA